MTHWEGRGHQWEKRKTRITYTCICALAGNQRPKLSRVQRIAKQRYRSLSWWPANWWRVDRYHALRKGNSFEREERARPGVRSSKRFAKIVRFFSPGIHWCSFYYNCTPGNYFQASWQIYRCVFLCRSLLIKRTARSSHEERSGACFWK